MPLTQALKQSVYAAVQRMAPRFGIRRLPTRVNAEWLQLPTSLWTGPRQIFDPFLIPTLEEYVEPGTVVFDIGAHVGLFSLLAAKRVGSTGRVIACEPSPAFEELSSAVGCTTAVAPLRVGIGAERGESIFHAQGAHKTGSFVSEVTELWQEQDEATPVSASVVPIRTIDDLAEEYGPPGLVKIDVEGFEHEVLRGATHTLRATRTVWVVEIHPVQLELSGSSEASIRDCFGDYRWTELHRCDATESPHGIYTILAEPRE